MTQAEFIALVRDPDLVRAEHVSDLRQMTEHFPYFAVPHLLIIKALKNNNSIHFSQLLKFSALYASNRKQFYYYLHPEKKRTTEQPRLRKSTSSGDYFDMMDRIEAQGVDKKQSLKDLAEKLKSARSMIVDDHERKRQQLFIEQPEQPIETYKKMTPVVSDVLTGYDELELRVKELIKSKKYSQAIEILRELNLNNSKKSVYFADQIRFFEKVIANSSK
jgi:hypothetical protein